MDDAQKASDIEETKAMLCPSCGEQMPHYGGSAGHIHCGYKILYRQDGWFDDRGLHVKDDRLAGGTRRVDGEVRQIQL
jgi:hypothetical protein